MSDPVKKAGKKRGRKPGATIDVTEKEREVILQFSALLHKLRTEKNLSMYELGVASKRNKHLIWQMEQRTNIRLPHFSTVIRLMDVLGYEVKFVEKQNK